LFCNLYNKFLGRMPHWELAWRQANAYPSSP